MPANINAPPKKISAQFDEWLYRFWTVTTGGGGGGGGGGGSSFSDFGSVITTASVIGANKVRVIGGPFVIEDGFSLTISDTGRLVLI